MSEELDEMVEDFKTVHSIPADTLTCPATR